MATNPINQQESRFINQVCSNTKTDFIEITEDKLENILIKFLNRYNKSRHWITLLSIVMTILISILTADFNKDFLKISKDIWCAIFYLGLFVSFILFINSIYYAIKHKNENKIENLLKTIKNNN